MAKLTDTFARSMPMLDEEDQPSHKKPKPDYKDTYNILIGSHGTQKPEEFILHKAIVDTRCSGLLEACECRGDSDDDLKDRFEVDVGTFQAFVHWLYTSEVDTRLLLGTKDRRGKTKPLWPAMLDLWLYAEAVFARELCDKITDTMLENFDTDSILRGVSNPGGFITAFNSLFEGDIIDPDSMIYSLFSDLLYTGMSLAWQPIRTELLSSRALLAVAYMGMQSTSKSQNLNTKEGRMREKDLYHICGE